jgi:hypothetical protein
MIERLKAAWQWILGGCIAILGIILYTKGSARGHTLDAARNQGAAKEHETLAASHAQAAQSEAKAAEQHHLDAQEAATAREEDITPIEVVKRAKRGRTV